MMLSLTVNSIDIIDNPGFIKKQPAACRRGAASLP